MSAITGQSPQFHSLQSALQSSLADKHLDKNELKQLKNLLENTPGLSAETKAGVMQFLDKAHSDSKGHFFGLFGRGISPSEMGALKDLASSQSNNPVLAGLVEDLEQLAAPPVTESLVRPEGSPSSLSNLSQNFVKQYNEAPFNPVAPGLSAPSQADSPFVANPTGSGEAVSGEFGDFYVTQNGNGLASGGGDCGPACAAMVAKRFGFIDDDASSREAIQTARQAAGVTQARDGAWAISESEVAQSVQRMTGGQVRQTAHQSFRSGQANELVGMLRSQIAKGAMPILETGSPYNSGGGRHYMVVMEVKPNGNLVLADPGGRGQWEMTPQKLAEEMAQADKRGGSHVLAFNR
ncbi:MAG: hypothetical protein IV090_18835 [Candidatus Sericytochromatia bacterium]|jgi:hypothetical protein|nr:hypothetical protein [Candidatus Sericytochromatia bacterium]